MTTDLLERPPAKPRQEKLPLRRAAGRFRRSVRRALKPLVMMFVAGGLAVSLTVTTTQDARAETVTVGTLHKLNGAMKIAMPSLVMTAIRLHPVGFAVTTIGALALGAYATKDHWLPYVAGDWGKPQGGSTDAMGTVGVNGYNGVASPDLKITGTTFSGKTAKVQLAHTGSASEVWFTTGWKIECKRADGTVYPLTGASLGIAGNADVPTYNTYSNKPSLTVDCTNTSDLAQSAVAGPLGGDPVLPKGCKGTSGCSGTYNYAGPANVFKSDGKPGFDPRGADVNYIVTAECIMPDGSKSMIEYTSRGTDGALRSPPCAVLKPGSHGTGKLTIDGVAPDGTKTRLWESDAINDAEHPLCSPSKASSGCAASIWIDGKECVAGNVECENWTEIFRDANTSARVSCHYGPYIVSPDKCFIMERAYTLDGAPATKENTDGDPGTVNFTEPNGQQYQKPESPTNPGTGTGTGTNTIPQAGANPSPNVEPSTDFGQCMGTGWSWNPVSWVMTPVQCALQWAFIPPRTRLDAATQSIQPRLDAKGIQPFITPFMANFGAIGGTGCKGPAISLGAVGVNQTFYPFDACQEPLAPIASGVNAFFGLSIILQGGMSCIRAAAAAFGFNWGFGGKDED